ncbi:MAG: group 1 glycosyl transferase, partial [Cyanobacteria bacterium 13_1_40CM_2_61_4]
ILITVDPEIPVPPKHYGGIERIVDMLARGLAARGHDVQLLCNPDSDAAVHLVPYAGSRSDSLRDTMLNAYQLWKHVHEEPVDIIHSFGRLAYLLPVLRLPIPKIQSYQRHVTARSVQWGNRLAMGTLTFTACSEYCAGTGRHAGGRWTAISNGVPMSKYAFSPSVPENAPLVFLGRVERIKGAHTAIKVALQTGKRLIIAGNRASEGPEADYFESEIAPHCCNDTQITYIGPVTDVQKTDLLGSAAALLFPIEWEEPFGIVMAEALACGTPVVAFNRGAVPEVVAHGTTGFLCSSAEDMVAAVSKIPKISRLCCRLSCEERFSADVIVNRYEELYRMRRATVREGRL